VVLLMRERANPTDTILSGDMQKATAAIAWNAKRAHCQPIYLIRQGDERASSAEIRVFSTEDL
jgi:hypothetical protein